MSEQPTTLNFESGISYLRMSTKKTTLSIRRGKNIVHIMHIEKNENQPKCPLTEEWVSMLYSAEHYSAVTNCFYDTFILREIFMSSSEVKK